MPTKITSKLFFATSIFLFITAAAHAQNIHSAVAQGDLEEVKSMLDADPLLVNREDAAGRTPLFTAVIRLDADMIRLLMDRGALVRVGDNNLRSPIHYAGNTNDTSLVALLLERGAVIDTRAIGGATPLIHSSLFDRFGMSQFLIDHGADINVQCNALTTPLYFAVFNNNLKYLAYLLEAGADCDVPDFLNRTPLFVAVRDGYMDVVRLLIDHGVDFRFRDVYLERSLLHLAAIHGHGEIAAFLIQKGMDVNGIDARGWTALDYARCYHHGSTADILKASGGTACQASLSAFSRDWMKRDLKPGEAVIIKLQNGSWGIRTSQRLLVLGYSEIGNRPPDASGRNGYLTGDEMDDIPWFCFDMNFHPPAEAYSLQGHTPLYSMQDRVKDLTFILNENWHGYYTAFELKKAWFPGPEQPLEFKGMTVKVIPSYGNKKGIFIEFDGLTLFWLAGLCDDYLCSKKNTSAVEWVKNRFSRVDLLFLGTPDGIGPEKGNGIRETWLESRDLNAGAVFFLGKEPLERRILAQIKRRGQNQSNIFCAENAGDVFLVDQGTVRNGSTKPVADVFKVMELASGSKIDELWPGFRVSEIPVLVFDGLNTYLFHSRETLDGFVQTEKDPAVWVYKGQHPQVRGNSIIRIGEDWMATSVLSASSRRTGEKYDLKDMAGIIVHEQFHVFQRNHHPQWRQNDGLLLRYPEETAEALLLRRMEKESFKRAVVSEERKEIVGWAKLALQFREERLGRVELPFALYEKELQLTEGLSDYIERMARGLDPLNASNITNGIAPAGIRDLGYVEGRWIAMIMDKLSPGWKSQLEREDSLYLEDILKAVLDDSPVPKRVLKEPEVETIKTAADVDFSEWQTRKKSEIEKFFDTPGFRIEIRSPDNPFVIRLFEPLEMEILDDGGVYHRLVFIAGNARGNLMIRSHPCITWFNNAYRITKIMINGLQQAPEIIEAEKKLIIKENGITVQLNYSSLRKDGSRYVVDLGME